MRTKKPKSLKRLRSARVLFPLATCSVALVIFSAVVYALAVPGVLMGDPSDGNNSIFSSLFSSASADTSNDASAQGQDGTVLPGGTSEDGSFTPAALPAAPTLGTAALGTLNSVVGETISQSGGTIHVANPEGSSNPSQDQNQNNNDQNQGQDQNQPSQEQPAEKPSVFDAETEDGFHEHILKSFSYLSSYYQDLYNGYNNIYADWNAGLGTSARSYPDYPENTIALCEKRKAEAQQCSYNGKQITSDSKWYKKYKEVCQLYDYLIEAGQLLKDFNEGHTQEYAANKLAAYKSKTGYDSPMNKFTTNYLEVGSNL